MPEIIIMATVSPRLLLLFAFIAVFLREGGCCVTPLAEEPNYWTSEDALDSEVSSGGRLRREVTLTERHNCGPADPQPPVRVVTTDRVDALIKEMKTKHMDAYIVPSQDEHQSEYVAEADQRRGFISAFTGSAGTVVVLASGVRALWTDGRYFLEADLQLDCNWLLMKSKQPGVPTIIEWLIEQLEVGGKVGLDPTLISATSYLKYQDQLKDSKIELVTEQSNLVDLVWTNKPLRSKTPVFLLETQFAGKEWTEKVREVREEMTEQNVDLMMITALDEIAWLLNLRGNDIPYNPVFRSYLLMDHTKVTLFLDTGRITPQVDFHLKNNQCDGDICLSVNAYDNAIARLSNDAAGTSVKKVLLPKKYSYAGGVSYAVYNAVPESKRLSAVSPVLELKARKNPVEHEGMKRAHIRDAVALVDFLAFFEKQIEKGESWSEMSAARRLKEYRAEQDHFMGLSFGTISAYGSNGAIIHYSPTNVTDKQITTDSLYLLDSGGQYKDGTTDVTRTLHYGSPSTFEIEAYTRVLMGSLDLARLIFPKGTGDANVDILARRPLFDVGLDYNHGTGHGIGMFLNVHEAPTQIRIYGKENHALELGHFFSDEPGFYKDGEFGIRLESILAVVPATTKYSMTKKEFYSFEAITLVPFEPKLIDTSMLNREQCDHLNDYHRRVRSIVGSALEEQGRTQGLAYLTQRTEPLNCETSEGGGAGEALTSATTVMSASSSSTSGGLERATAPSVVLFFLAWLLARYVC